MKKSDAINYFGNQSLLADALNIRPPAVSQWPDLVPEKQALKLEKLTNGALKYDPNVYVKVA
jgi:DNA-binding transcriptional regulator YdaS (Cro superfamily)